LKKRTVEGNKDKGMYCIGIQSVLYRYFVGNFFIFYPFCQCRYLIGI
jgi:hypothetical protein